MEKLRGFKSYKKNLKNQKLLLRGTNRILIYSYNVIIWGIQYSKYWQKIDMIPKTNTNNLQYTDRCSIQKVE